MRMARLLILVFLLASSAAQAATSGQAFGESLQLQLLPLLGSPVSVQSGPLPVAAGSGSPFSQTVSAASIGVTLTGLGQILNTGVLDAHTLSSSDGAVTSDATVNDLGLSLANLLTLSADEVRATATIGGTCGTGLTVDAGTTLVNAHLGGIVGLGGGIGGTPGPNTVAVNALGIQVILNEQVIGGDGLTTRTVSVNAIHVSINNSILALIGALTGDIIIGHAEAATQCTPVPPPPAQADLSLSLTASPNPVTVGQTLTYTLRVTNFGPASAPNVTAANTLPAGVTLLSYAASQGSCTDSGAAINCGFGTLPAGQAATLVIQVQSTAAGTLVDFAQASSSLPDPDPSDNSTSVTSTALGSGGNPPPPPPGPQADLSVTLQTMPDTIVIGDSVRFIFKVLNQGPDTATSVVLSDALPARATIVSMNASQGSCSSQSIFVCNLGSLGAGAQATVTMEVTPQGPGPLLCQGTASSALVDPDPGDNTASGSANVIALPVPAENDKSGVCQIDAVPAATLLFPYFEVNLDRPQGATTLISINNSQAATRYAQVTLWTDWGIPTMSFTVPLSGYDVQTLNLRDLLSGNLPSSVCGSSISATDKAVAAADLQNWHSGRMAPSKGTCAAPSRTDHMATGYVTVDVVKQCTSQSPADAGYFASNGLGLASDENALWGDFFLVNDEENQAHGDPAVHIVSRPDKLGSGDYTFYARFVGGTGADHREPLGTRYATRYLLGGLFDGGTQLIIWRDSKTTMPKAGLTCGQEPARMEMEGLSWDESENVTGIPSSKASAPWSSQKLVLGGTSLTVGSSFGWLQLDLWHQQGSMFGEAAQGWVTTILSARQRYSIGLRAVRLDSACDF